MLVSAGDSLSSSFASSVEELKQDCAMEVGLPPPLSPSLPPTAITSNFMPVEYQVYFILPSEGCYITYSAFIHLHTSYCRVKGIIFTLSLHTVE